MYETIHIALFGYNLGATWIIWVQMGGSDETLQPRQEAKSGQPMRPTATKRKE